MVFEDLKSIETYQKPKIICPSIARSGPAFAFDTDGYFFKSGYGIILKATELSYKYILGLSKFQVAVLGHSIERICTSHHSGRVYRTYDRNT